MHEQSKAEDPFFQLIPDGDWNACIGKQGDELNYLDGYIEAAVELASAVIEKQLIGSRDTLALPILYNGRHAIELALKFTVNRLQAFGAIASSHTPNHDILSHWQHLHDCNVGDRTIRELVAELHPYVKSLANVDDDGQELRYAENRSGQKSLSDHAVVNLCLIRESLQSLGKLLNRLKCRVLAFEEESPTGTHTPYCSRRDLTEIACLLGNQKCWRGDSFSEAKLSIKSTYNLSNKQFSNAIYKIRASRELSVLVGLEHDLQYLSDEKALFVIEHWVKAHPVRKRKSRFVDIKYFQRNTAEMDKYFKAVSEANQKIMDALTLEEFSDLEVLFYIGRGGEFGEVYDKLLKNKVEGYRKTSLQPENVHHIVSKTNLLDCVARGCAIVGRPRLKEALLKSHSSM